MIFTHLQSVSFGDCDPAGIVFYPRYLEWFDRTFHTWLRSFGGHDAICASLGAAGIGLMGIDAKFHSPLRDGDDVHISLSVAEWGNRSVYLAYEGRCRDTLIVTGTEVRGLFVRSGDSIRAAELDSLRNVLEHHVQG